jgi:hypothetical protein
MRAPRPVRALPDASLVARPGARPDAPPDSLLVHGYGTDGQPAERLDESRRHTEELTGVTSGLNPGDGPGARSQDDGNTDRHPAAVVTIVDCPRCRRPVPPATDHDRVADVCGPHPPGWRLCWCGYAWTPGA